MATDKVTALRFATEAKLPQLGLLGERDLTITLPPVSFDSDKDQALVVGPQLFSFVQGVTPERREMIATSALFASLAADAQTSRDKPEWRDEYAKALGSLGWTLGENVSRSFDQEHKGSKVHEAVLEFITALGVGGGALALITATLKAMQKVDKDQPWITLFDYQTRVQTIAGFQIGLVDQKPEGDFDVKLVSFTLTVGQTHAQILFLSFDTLGIHMDSIANTVTIAEAVLKDAMPTIQDRLKLYVKRYVTEVKLPDLPT